MASSIADALVAGDYHRVVSAQANIDGSKMGENAASIASLLGSLSDHTIAGDYNQKCEMYDALYQKNYAKSGSATQSKVSEMIEQGLAKDTLDGNRQIDIERGSNHAKNSSSTSVLVKSRVLLGLTKNTFDGNTEIDIERGTNYAHSSSSTQVLLNTMVEQGPNMSRREAAEAIDVERGSNHRNSSFVKHGVLSDITIERLSRKFSLFLVIPADGDRVISREYHSIRDGTNRMQDIFRKTGKGYNYYSINAKYEVLEKTMRAADMYSRSSVFPGNITYCLVRKGFEFPAPVPISTTEGLPSPPFPIGDWKIDWNNVPVIGKMPYGSGERGIREGGGGPNCKLSEYALKQHERFVTLADLYRAEKNFKGAVYLVYTDTAPPQIVSGEEVKKILLGWGCIRQNFNRTLREKRSIISIIGPVVIFSEV